METSAGVETNFGAFSVDVALVGLDLGEDSPETGSWPKKFHFFADRGVDGDDGEVATSMSKGIEFRLRGASSVCVASVTGSAVRGRLSVGM